MRRCVVAILWLVLPGVACAKTKRTTAPAEGSTPPAATVDSGIGTVLAGEVADASAEATTAPLRLLGAYANVNPTDDLIVGPPELIPDCEALLTEAGVTFHAARLPVHTEPPSKITCGAPQVIVYLRGPGRVAYDPSPLLTCGMALAMASFERLLQDEANRRFQSPVARIQQIGTYNCRGIVRFKGVASEHSYANAIDLARFTLKNGKTITVLSDFDMGEEFPAKPAGAFLRAISERAFDEDVFSNVLTPFWDAAHKNHFHLDLARYRVNGVRPAAP